MSDDLIAQLRTNVPGYHPGWNRREFTTWREEQLSWKTTCSLGDWSFLWDVRFTGPDVLRVFSDLSINGFSSFEIGQAKHVVQCSEAGKVIGDGVLMRVGEQEFRAQGVPALHTSWAIAQGQYDAQWEKLDTFQLQVSGPTALAVCQEATGRELTDIKFMRFDAAEIAGIPVYALRQGMAGEIGFELHGPAAGREAVVERLTEVGEKHGIVRIGARTVMLNHLEAAFPTGGWHYLKDSYNAGAKDSVQWIKENFGQFPIPPTIRGSFVSDDVNDYLQSPIALGWGRSIRFDHNFVGRSALEAEAAQPTRTRVTLEFEPEDIIGLYASLFQADNEPFDILDMPHSERWIAWADAVLGPEGQTIGVSTTPGYSLYFRRVLTLAFIDPAYAEPGTEVEVLWGNPGTPQTKLRATVRPAPYKKDNRRTDLGAHSIAR